MTDFSDAKLKADDDDDATEVLPVHLDSLMGKLRQKLGKQKSGLKLFDELHSEMSAMCAQLCKYSEMEKDRQKHLCLGITRKRKFLEMQRQLCPEYEQPMMQRDFYGTLCDEMRSINLIKMPNTRFCVHSAYLPPAAAKTDTQVFTLLVTNNDYCTTEAYFSSQHKLIVHNDQVHCVQVLKKKRKTMWDFGFAQFNMDKKLPEPDKEQIFNFFIAVNV